MTEINNLSIIFPTVLWSLIIVVSGVPFHISGFNLFLPLFGLQILFYWTIFKPSTLPYWMVFILGIFQDAILGTAIGISSLTYIVIRFILIMHRDRITSEIFIIVWSGFALITALAILFQWLCYSLATSYFYDSISPIIMQFVLTALSYPVMHFICSIIYNMMPLEDSDA